MKEFIQSSSSLTPLVNYVKEKGVSLKSLPVEKKASIKIEEELSDEQQKFKANRAATIIQRTYRAYKMKQKIRNNPYSSYLSMMDRMEVQRIPAHILFGRHIAEIRPTSKNQIKNPYIYSDARYHRDDDLSGILLNSLIDSFNIDEPSRSTHDYVPVTLLDNTPAEDIISRYFPQPMQKTKPQPQVIKDTNHSIALIAIPHGYYRADEVKGILSICGLVASPWEIAINVKVPPLPLIEPEQVNPALNTLPTTKEALLKSKPFNKLLLIAKSPKHSTNKLATGLRNLLIDLPELNQKAIQRIAIMLQVSCHFYDNNYPQFAFCLYTIIHEISLCLLEPKDLLHLEKDFSRFKQETEKVLLQTLDLKKEQLTQTTFFASLAMSGTNAYVIAMHLAQKMKTEQNKKPKIKIYGTNYYEFDFITKATKKSDADVFIICTGPTVTETGLIPGIDINRLINQEIISKKRTKPVTVIIDATSTLYKNLRLNTEVQSLVKEGKLSLIIHESIQKFGLLHTDQPQCGKVYGLCSKGSYAGEVLQELQRNAQNDFNNHVDLRIGAYISNNCGHILEEIKRQHFVNGSLLRNILIQAKLIDAQVIGHPYMLSNLDELYFVSFDPEKSKQLEESTLKFIEHRDSFGHFCTTRSIISDFVDSDEIMQTRISVDASDTIDCLIQTSQLFLASCYTTEEILDILLENARKSDLLSYDEQIISLGLINILVADMPNGSPMIRNRVEVFAAISCLLEQCFLLKGRQYTANAHSYLQELQKEISNMYQPKYRHNFMQSIHTLYRQGTPLNPNVLEQLKLSNEQLIDVPKNKLSFFNADAAAVETAELHDQKPKICDY
ncbi:hypothetical protein OQJ26_05795 [Legionella sp. PATHC038]|uniref:IQ calmodulin-binding motif-containing protein n=1 Tax=Legionella sheltonii TaxID=2992041 RepID=UPI002243BD38|nr:hypothetical protein [Legionella sp. PATHC038]MCW8398302.1 hypothetical protein [Legionella sp. PATHC038]